MKLELSASIDVGLVYPNRLHRDGQLRTYLFMRRKENKESEVNVRRESSGPLRGHLCVLLINSGDLNASNN